MTAQLPPNVPRLRSLFNSFKFVNNPIPFLNGYLEEHGDSFLMYLGGVEKGIVTVDPDLTMHVLQKNHRNYQKSKIQTRKLGHFIGQGLLTSNGDYWLQQRRLIQPGFHRKRIAALVDIMNAEIGYVLDRVGEEIKNDPEVDITARLTEIAFRIMARSLFSTSLPEEELQHLRDVINEMQEFIIRLIRQPYLLPYFKVSGIMREKERLTKEAFSLMLKYIRQRRESGEQADDLLQMLLDARYEDTDEGMTDQQILEEALILFVAGHETSAHALTWTMKLLTEHPDILRKVRAECEEILDNRKAGFEDLKNLDLLTRVIEESMRLYPPAWVTDREALAADEAAGAFVPKGCLVVPYIYGIHRNPKLWKDPDQFDPDRFLPEHKANRHKGAYIPFGAGPRLCIGNHFAMMEMQLVLAELIRRFNFSPVNGKSIWPRPLLTLKPSENLILGISGRR